jgi:hypothetical protein
MHSFKAAHELGRQLMSWATHAIGLWRREVTRVHTGQAQLPILSSEDVMKINQVMYMLKQ